MSDTYTTIFGGHENLNVPGESAMTVGPVESHSIFGTNVTAADAEIPTIAAPAAGPVDMTPIPIQAGGPDANSVIPINDKVTYGMSTFGGPVRDVAGLGAFNAFGAELMLEQTKHGQELVQAAAGLGRYVAGRNDFGRYVGPRNGDFGGLGAVSLLPRLDISKLSPDFFKSAVPTEDPQATTSGMNKKWLYGGIAVAALVVIGAVMYTRKPAA